MILVIKVDVAFEDSVFASLEYEDRPRLIENWNVIKYRFSAQDTDTTDPGLIVAQERSRLPG